MENIDVLYASDNNFVEVMAISIVSLLENNQDNHITLFIASQEISEENAQKLKKLVSTYQNCDLKILEIPDLNQIIGEEVDIKRYSKSMFSRIIAGTLLPQHVNRLLYLDCDTLILGNLRELYEIDLEGKTLGAVNDCRNIRYNNNLGMKKDSVYINSGVLLMDLKQYRQKNYEELLIDKIKLHNGELEFPDNDIICRYLEDDIKLIHPKYNAISVLFACNWEQLLRLRKPHLYYKKEEYEEAVEKPVIVHFTTCVLLPARPWYQGYQHKYAKEYLVYRELTPWGDQPLRIYQESGKRKLMTKLINSFPLGLAIWAYGILHAFIKPTLQKKVNTHQGEKTD